MPATFSNTPIIRSCKSEGLPLVSKKFLTKKERDSLRKVRLCPLMSAGITRITKHTFIKLCTKHQQTGTSAGKKWIGKEKWSPCDDCKTGRQVKKGNLKKAPERFEWIAIPEKKSARMQKTPVKALV